MRVAASHLIKTTTFITIKVPIMGMLKNNKILAPHRYLEETFKILTTLILAEKHYLRMPWMTSVSRTLHSFHQNQYLLSRIRN